MALMFVHIKTRLPKAVLMFDPEYLEWLDTLEEDDRPIATVAEPGYFNSYTVSFQSDKAATMFKLRWL